MWGTSWMVSQRLGEAITLSMGVKLVGSGRVHGATACGPLPVCVIAPHTSVQGHTAYQQALALVAIVRTRICTVAARHSRVAVNFTARTAWGRTVRG